MCNDTQNMENEYHRLGHVDGAEVGVQHTLDGQDIFIQHGAVGQRLACLLTIGNAEIVRRGNILYWRVSHNHELREALQEAGIIGRPCRELLRLSVDPDVVRAWHLWTWAPEQEWMDNPAGYVVNRLREGDEPPEEFLELARLTPDETNALKTAWASSEQYMDWPSLDGNDRLRRLALLWAAIYDGMKPATGKL